MTNFWDGEDLDPPPGWQPRPETVAALANAPFLDPDDALGTKEDAAEGRSWLDEQAAKRRSGAGAVAETDASALQHVMGRLQEELARIYYQGPATFVWISGDESHEPREVGYRIVADRGRLFVRRGGEPFGGVLAHPPAVSSAMFPYLPRRL
jgi:hypothetical protein